MQQATKESIAHTIRSFWSARRVLKLFIFALLMANVSLYCVGTLARRQVIANATNQHSKLYMEYLQAVERARSVDTSKEQVNNNKDKDQGDVEQGEIIGKLSPYWFALREVRKQFPFYKMHILLPTTADSERDKKILDLFKQRPKGWSLSDESEGWARTFYVLPTKNIAAFQVVSYVRDDLKTWEWASVSIAAYSFALLFAFGWFWTRSLEEPNRSRHIKSKLRAMDALVAEMGISLSQLEQRATEHQALSPKALQALDELSAQIRLLAVNGSIEAARSAESYRVFHVIMQEINQLASQSRDLLKDCGAAGSDHAFEQELKLFRRKLYEFQSSANVEAGAEQQNDPSASSRRVG